MKKIPKILHYCFGYGRDFGGKPWSLFHYACVRSAIERIKPDQVFLYYEFEPSGVWWDLTRKMVTPLQEAAPQEVFGRPLLHPAHRADVVRLQKLIEHGGIYLDADVLVHRDFDDLLENSAVLGQEGAAGAIGLANAVILAESGAPFLKRWYEEYRSFRSRGRDQFWNEHSVQVPSELAKANPSEITVLPFDAFYWPLWTPDQIGRIFEPVDGVEVRASYANHLWESRAWDKYLEHLTPGRVRRIDSPFHRWVRPFIANLPDDYGAPTLAERAKHTKKLMLQRLEKFMRDRKAWLRDQIRDAFGPNFIPGVKSVVRLNEPLAWPLLQRLTPKALKAWQRRRIFQTIYSRGLWGKDGDAGAGRFFSGVGSRGAAATAYVDRMTELLADWAEKAQRSITVVDLGCGDFAIGHELIARLPSLNYIGCDIVPELIEHHNKAHSSDRVRFQAVDIVAEHLPSGDVCLVRQVLQHLSNDDIQHVLPKLEKYRAIYISEGQPMIVEGPINPDKPIGSGVRFDWRTGRGRGLELDQPPFNRQTRAILSVPASANEMVVTVELIPAGVSRDLGQVSPRLRTIRNSVFNPPQGPSIPRRSASNK